METTRNLRNVAKTRIRSMDLFLALNRLFVPLSGTQSVLSIVYIYFLLVYTFIYRGLLSNALPSNLSLPSPHKLSDDAQ